MQVGETAGWRAASYASRPMALTDLVVAPLTDAARVAAIGMNARQWPWVDVKGLRVEGMQSLCSLLEDLPFDEIASSGDVVVYRVPPGVVNALAALDRAGVDDLALRWKQQTGRSGTIENFATGIYMILDVARTAHERGHELYVWTCP